MVLLEQNLIEYHSRTQANMSMSVENDGSISHWVRFKGETKVLERRVQGRDQFVNRQKSV